MASRKKRVKEEPAENHEEEAISISRIREDIAYRNRLRRRCQTDLFFLGKTILGYDKISVRTHSEVAKFFVQKNPDKTIGEQDKIKQRLLMMPRGTFKTTFNICDTVQWILAFPDIGILAMTASNSPDSPLADAYVEEVASHFYQAAGETPKILHELFPEYVIFKMPKKGNFTTPARQNYRREPTLMGNSIETSLSGWHFDVMKIEDIQDNRNSQTAFGIKKVRQNLFINLGMLMSWGYREMTGTRYGPADVYGYVMDRLDPSIAKVMWKPAMEVKPEVFRRQHDLRDKREDYTFLLDTLEEDDWDLFFPEFLPYDVLMSKRNEDESSFMTQQMNVATGNFKPIFPMERLLSATISQELMPIHGTPRIAWRFELGDSNMVSGAAGYLEGGRMFVSEVARGSYTPSTLAMKVVALSKKHSCTRVTIEDTPGARYMEAVIQNEAIKQSWDVEINWVAFQKDEKERSLRIKSCEPVLADKRLIFSREIYNLKEVHRQLYHYGMIEDTEVADVISRLCETLPRNFGTQDDQTYVDDLNWTILKDKDAQDKLYNRGAYAPPPPPTPSEADEVEWEPPTNQDGLQDMMPGLE